MDYKTEYAALQAKAEAALQGYFADRAPQDKLFEAMRYSLLAGGKRIRPVLVMRFCAAAGGDADKALPFACGIEMLHTYSLIHDDLPCMDNDELRRGKPTNHVVYGECAATLAGDALQAAAFSTVLAADLPASARAEGARILADAAGERGMCGGQYLDTLAGGEKTAEELLLTSDLKTGAMFKAACLMGVAAAGDRATAAQREAAAAYGLCLSRAFQIRDDLLDVISTDEVFGKPVGSDAANGKTTFATLYGAEGCAKLISGYTREAKEAVGGAFADSGFFLWFADLLENRSF